MIVTTKRTGPRWAKSWRRYRNYVFIVITMVLVAMQVYLYMSTPTAVADSRSVGGRNGEGLPHRVINEIRENHHVGDNVSSALFSLNGRQHSSQQWDVNDKLSNHQRQEEQRSSSVADDDHFRKSKRTAVPQNVSNNSIHCGALDPFTQSALNRAHSRECKREITQVACAYKRRELYPPRLPQSCPLSGPEYGRYLGCFGNNNADKKLISDQMTEFPDTNTPTLCINHCLRSGFEYVGLQNGVECWCGASFSANSVPASEPLCDVPCPGDEEKMCGGENILSVYRTGHGVRLVETVPYVDIDDPDVRIGPKARIVFVLTVSGRALRQVHRLLKAIYRPNHYYYIHVDARHDYLHRELSKTTSHLPNVRMAPTRFASIWGGASLLTMLLRCMGDLVAMAEWHWDYLLNLSESDYPVKTVEELEAFLTKYPAKNFVKSHGKDTPKFIQKQGLNMLFYECDNHMWRLGSRDLQDGIRMDGGSDWVCLSRDFVHYLTYGNDRLLTGLKAFWKYSLLPAESFFHTVLQNSPYCTTIINNNLHLTNWHRKQGCKCQYKHIVDWCGCSPNDFKTQDLQRIASLAGKPIYLSRKFEAIVNQEVLNNIDALNGIVHHSESSALNSFWLNDYHYMDDRPADDIAYSFYLSFTRLTFDRLNGVSNKCGSELLQVLESTVYSYNDTIQGLILTFDVSTGEKNLTHTIETLVEPITIYKSFVSADPVSRLKSVKVGTNYDPKEEIFRNYGGLFGPQSDVVVEFRWGPGKPMVVTAVFIDPSGTVAVSYDVSVTQGGLVHTYRPEMRKPLRPGMWTLKVMHAWRSVVELQFLILPYSHIGKNPVALEAARLLHSGPGRFYVNQNFTGIRKRLKLDDAMNEKLEAEANAGKHGDALLAWVDELVQKTWRVKDTCLVTTDAVRRSSICLPVSACHETPWSTRFPDPKSDLSDLNLEAAEFR